MPKNYTKDSHITIEDIFAVMSCIKNKQYRASKGISRIPYILHMRLMGWTLSKIAEKYNLQRERIRQQEAKGVEIAQALWERKIAEQ